MKAKKTAWWSKIPNRVWVLISLVVAAIFWLIVSRVWPTIFASPAKVLNAVIDKGFNSGIL